VRTSDGDDVGAADGDDVGAADGDDEETTDGDDEGTTVEDDVAATDGVHEGTNDGDTVGHDAIKSLFRSVCFVEIISTLNCSARAAVVSTIEKKSDITTMLSMDNGSIVGTNDSWRLGDDDVGTTLVGSD